MQAHLIAAERIYYRDRLRQARYAALADSEGFELICYAVEELGIRLSGQQGDLRKYKAALEQIVVNQNTAPPELSGRFSAVYEIIRRARNDAMHSGAYARHVTSKAIELCITLEDALMNGSGEKRRVGDYMVKEPVYVEDWQPVARARQLMLTHSFSNLPVSIDGIWHLLTEIGLAAYVLENRGRDVLATPVLAAREKLRLVRATTVSPDEDIAALLTRGSLTSPALWLVTDPSDRLLGVISAFELM